MEIRGRRETPSPAVCADEFVFPREPADQSACAVAGLVIFASTDFPRTQGRFHSKGSFSVQNAGCGENRGFAQLGGGVEGRFGRKNRGFASIGGFIEGGFAEGNRGKDRSAKLPGF